MSLIQTIETDLQAAGKWLEAEFETVAKEVWGVVANVFHTQEPALVASVLSAIQDFLKGELPAIASGTPLEDLETQFLHFAQQEGGTLVADVEKMGSVLFQALMALAIKDLTAGIV